MSLHFILYAASDYYQLDDLLTPEEKNVRNQIRKIMVEDVAPIMVEYWEKAEFPHHITPKFGALGFAGGPIEGYGCKMIPATACAVAYAEIGRVDPSIGSSLIVHSCLTTLLIAQHGSDEQKQKFIVKKGAPGLTVTKIENKVALRIVQNRDVIFDNVFVPDEDKLPYLTSFQGFVKAWITLLACETVALGRELLGGNGILTDFLVAKAFCDMEPIYSYEDTYEINCLITGREITGIASFKHPAMEKLSRL
ncbi:Acyl-CoA oxidase 4 [Rhynchospora pubera]|uniref:Acyl-CoA oxidase 4 n=1 Tax=Rhynchospora pubera TaxID=906938 RepID=A0AAV8ED52_9POAL|nr:Acyl-CoA oxidase 4 [Rhynchospora pubera]